MGRFALARRDEPIEFHGKAPNRPIDLLKALVALGGHAVADARLIDILWPDPARAGSGKALEIAIHRLRKLLGAEGAVVVGHRAVTLSSRQVWVDAWELERMLASLVPVGAPPPIHLLEAKAADVLALYRGHF
ncbi:MAG TPA: helix-turn-helix domain-containing protein, partial [Casimicrobiaceae bacterium]|nr:helix-turn-helix domain-containing protein [Casimicrobiaceae bacterium]